MIVIVDGRERSPSAMAFITFAVRTTGGGPVNRHVCGDKYGAKVINAPSCVTGVTLYFRHGLRSVNMVSVRLGEGTAGLVPVAAHKVSGGGN